MAAAATQGVPTMTTEPAPRESKRILRHRFGATKAHVTRAFEALRDYRHKISKLTHKSGSIPEENLYFLY